MTYYDFRTAVYPLLVEGVRAFNRGDYSASRSVEMQAAQLWLDATQSIPDGDPRYDAFVAIIDLAREQATEYATYYPA